MVSLPRPVEHLAIRLAPLTGLDSIWLVRVALAIRFAKIE
jgi:hypothetical protein